jgi:anthranilate phosphoribosyltransferase
MDLLLQKLLASESLQRDEAKALFAGFAARPIAQQAAILALWHAKKETQDEVLGAWQHFIQYSSLIESPVSTVDLVGTGGDGAKTFNISTAASLLLASCGVFVAKHGGRGVSSRVGSHDVMEALKIPAPVNASEVCAILMNHHYVYLRGACFNSELKNFGPLRQQLGFPTIFNVLGPLLNPLQPKRLVIGVYRPDLLQTVADFLKIQGVTHALVVHSEDGLDELSVSASSRVVELNNGEMVHYQIDPRDFGFDLAELSALRGGDVSENAQLIEGVLSNQIKGPKQEVVLLNTAAGLYVAGVCQSIARGIEIARQALETGAAMNLLLHLRAHQ